MQQHKKALLDPLVFQRAMGKLVKISPPKLRVSRCAFVPGPHQHPMQAKRVFKVGLLPVLPEAWVIEKLVRVVEVRELWDVHWIAWRTIGPEI